MPREAVASAPLDCWGYGIGGAKTIGTLALPDWDDIALKGRDIFIAFDSDVAVKASVREAMKRFRGFLEHRGAQPSVVFLPPAGDAKTGIDDYLLTHTADELTALARSNGQSRGSEVPTASPLCPYVESDRGLFWRKATRDGTVSIHLTNFTAKIVSDIVRDDGAEKIREYELEATLQGRASRFLVRATQFAAMNWAAEHLGAQAMVYPGQALKDHARAAIQSLSENITQRRIFAHTGWRRNHHGEWYFFHGGGVLGGNGHVPNMEVALPNGLERLTLPDAPLGDGVHIAVRASLNLLDVATDEVSVPIVSAIWRAPLGAHDMSEHLSGPTGSGKTELAALAQQHYGQGFDARYLPGS
jgi:hypothetical protein